MNASDNTPLDHLKKIFDRVLIEVPIEQLVRHHCMCALVYRQAARTYPALARQALTYAIMEQRAADRARIRAKNKLETLSARLREFDKIYRPFEPRTVAEARVLLALSKPEHRWDYSAWLAYYKNSVHYYAQVVEVSKVEQKKAEERCRKALASVDQYRTLIEGPETS